MTQDRWQRIQELFEAALEMGPTEQKEYLEIQCGDDKDLIDEVSDLLKADNSTHSFLAGWALEDKKLGEEISLIGRSVSHYEIIESLGKGGMAEVFLADDIWLNRKVAIKFLPMFNASNRMSRVRFLREAQAAARLTDPNIVAIHEISEFENRPYIVMEYVPGLSLRQKIARERISPTDALLICRQIALGVLAAHQAGIVHRDLKPENVVIDNKGRAKILDFGIARVSDGTELTKTGSLLGTPNYMAPEQAKGMRVDTRTDIFSLGVILYEMISGVSPFARNSMAASIQAVINDPIPELEQSGAKTVSLQSIINRAAAKDVDERYSSIDELLADIESVLLETGDSKALLTNSLAGHKVRSLAVLCLKTLGSTDDEFLSYGITEDLIIDLSRLPGLRLASMRTVLAYKNTHADLNQIASELKVDFILDGSIHRSDDGFRLSAQLVEAATGKNLWVQRWEREIAQIAAIKEELAASVKQALGLSAQMSPTFSETARTTTNAEAYEFYLRGKYTYEHKQNTADLSVATGLYKKALLLEPSLIEAGVGLAQLLMYNGELDKAETELSSALSRAEADHLRPQEALILNLMVQLHNLRNDWSSAYDCGLKALEIKREQDDLAGEAKILADLVTTLLPQGKNEQALAYLDRILEINRLLDDEQKVADSLKSIGKLYRQLSEYDKAQEYYEEALLLARKQGDQALESACLGNLGNVHLCRNDLDEAQSHYEQALEIDARLNNKSSLQAWYSNLAHIFDAKGDLQKATDCLNQAKIISKSLNDNRVYSHALCSSSAMHLKRGDFDEAKKDASEALKVSSDIGYVAGICSALLQVGSAQIHSGPLAQAEENLNQAITKSREAGLTRHLCWAQEALAELFYLRDKFEQAQPLFETSLQLAENIGDEFIKLRARCHLLAADQTGDSEAAISSLEEMVNSLKPDTDQWTSLMVSRLLRETQVRRGDPELKQGGLARLKDLLEDARLSGIAPETRRIEQFIGRNSST